MKPLLSSLLAIAIMSPTHVLAAKPASPSAPAAAATFSEGMATPESVLYDAQNDVYLVSNINGSPLEKDNNGYVAVISPDDKKVTRLLEAGKNKVTLNAPKGMAIANGVLYVADIDTVRMFDRKTGAPKGELPIPGATFLNDVAASPDGKSIYVSDSGLKQGAKDFEPTGTDAIYVINDGKVSPVLKDKNLGKPNGILANANNTLSIVNFGNNELWSYDLKKPKAGAAGKTLLGKLPKGSLDGIVQLPDGDLLISSWEAGAIFRGKPGGEFNEVLSGVAAPADIGYDSKRNLVLVPRFMDNKVEAYALGASVAPPALAK